ncbi:hypothetical protein CF335_g8938, partial [Tilletia laevis]
SSSPAPEPTAATSKPAPIFAVPANRALVPRTGPTTPAPSSSTSTRPKAKPLKPGQPDRNLDIFTPRKVRVERAAVPDSESEEELSPGRIQRDIQKAAQIGKKVKKKTAAGVSLKSARNTRSESDSEFDDPTDEDTAVPTSAPNPKKTTSTKSISIDLTANSQEDSDQADSASKSTTSPAKASTSPSERSIKGKDKAKEEPPKRTRKEPTPEKALEAAKKAWRAAQAAAEQDAIEESKSGVVGRRAPSNIYIYFKEPVLAEHPTNSAKGQGVGFWCTGCCAESQLVWRPFTDSSTSNLRAHTETKASLSNRVNLAKAGQTGPMDAFVVKKTGPASGPHITAAEARQIAVEWITSSSRPISIIEDQGFSKLLTPELVKILPGRKVVGDDVVRIYDGMLDVIKARLADVVGCFHLALDVWTSKNGSAFLGITVNYQEKGEAKRHLLDMLPFLAAHDSKNMSKAVYQSIERVGITDRVWNIVTDNASENSAMLPLLSAMGGMPRFRGKASQVRCMAHICNLVSQAVANTFIKAASSVQTKKHQELIDDLTDEEDTAPDEDHSSSDEEEEGNSAEGTMNAEQYDIGDDDDEHVDVLDESDHAISSALCPELAANSNDEEELREILSGPSTRPRSLHTPTSSQAGPSSSAP